MFDTSDLLAYRKLIGPGIIRILFWLGIILVILTGISTSVNDNPVMGMLVIVVGILLVRVLSEILMLPFLLNEKINCIEATLEQKNAKK